MLGEAQRLREALELRERVAAEAAVDLGRDEGVALVEDPLADAGRGARTESTKSISSVFGIGAQRLARRPCRPPSRWRCRRRSRGRAEARRGRWSTEGAARRRRGGRCPSPRRRGPRRASRRWPRARRRGGARPRRRARRRGVADLPDLARHELARGRSGPRRRRRSCTSSSRRRAATTRPIAPCGTRRSREDAVDAGRHLGAVRQRDRQGIERGEVAEAEVHRRSEATTRRRSQARSVPVLSLRFPHLDIGHHPVLGVLRDVTVHHPAPGVLEVREDRHLLVAADVDGVSKPGLEASFPVRARIWKNCPWTWNGCAGLTLLSRVIFTGTFCSKV